jgi:hypothetical protein
MYAGKLNTSFMKLNLYTSDPIYIAGWLTFKCIQKRKHYGGFTMKWLVCVVALFPFWANSGSLYLCRAYSGGIFWTQAHCNQHSALIERIVSVPDSLPFDQQVKLAEQQQQPATSTTTVTNRVINSTIGPDHQSECRTLDAQITQFDAMARQPQSGSMQDWITSQKRKTRDRQFAIKC